MEMEQQGKRKTMEAPANNTLVTGPGIISSSQYQCKHCSILLIEQVYSCKEAHLLCPDCYQAEDKCLHCGTDLAGRCRAVENSIAATDVNCMYKDDGCNESIPAPLMLGYGPYHCPVPQCGFRGPVLSEHIRNDHIGRSQEAATLISDHSKVQLRRTEKLKVLLHDQSSEIIVLINYDGSEHLPNSLWLLRIGPPPMHNLTATLVVSLPAVEARKLSCAGPMPWRRTLEELNDAEKDLPFYIPDFYWSSSKRA